jgi:hypothetical protein
MKYCLGEINLIIVSYFLFHNLIDETRMRKQESESELLFSKPAEKYSHGHINFSHDSGRQDASP